MNKMGHNFNLTSALKPLGTFKFWQELFILTVGTLLTAAAVYYFIVPSKLVLGSFSGFCIMLAALLETYGIYIKVSTVVLIGNIFLVLIAMGVLGKEFGIKTIFVSVLQGPMMDVMDRLLPYTSLYTEVGQTSVMNDPWLDLVCFVLMLSIAQAVLFRINSSTGGLDIIAMIICKFRTVDIGTALTVCGAVVCLTGFLIHPMRMVIIGLIGTWLNGVAIDYFIASINRRKRVCVISDRSDEIRNFIIHNIGRGCSLYDVRGGYSDVHRVEVQALLTQNEFGKLMKFIRDNEMQVFVTAGNVSEIYGNWLNKRRLPVVHLRRTAKREGESGASESGADNGRQ